MVVAKIRYEEGSYEGEVNEGKGKDDIHFLKMFVKEEFRWPPLNSSGILAAWSNLTFY
jgi:hypothetical protein